MILVVVTDLFLSMLLSNTAQLVHENIWCKCYFLFSEGVGYELNKEVAMLAQKNVEDNKLQEKIKIIHGGTTQQWFLLIFSIIRRRIDGGSQGRIMYHDILIRCYNYFYFLKLYFLLFIIEFWIGNSGAAPGMALLYPNLAVWLLNLEPAPST